MSSVVARVRGLVRRYRVDRRLPPTVRELHDSVLRVRRRDSAAARIAAVKPVLGVRPDDVDDDVARLDNRRVATAGRLDTSIYHLSLGVASTVADGFTEAGVDTFAVDRIDGTVELGIPLSERTQALGALTRLRESGWLVRWAGGSSAGLVPAADSLQRRAVRRARTWTVFRSFRQGELATGDEAGVMIGFWTPGTSGQMEKIGTRGNMRFDPRSPSTVEVIDGHEFPGKAAFPVGSNLEHVSDPVDIVYTWVDGSDPEWAESFRRTATEHGRAVDEVALDPARYTSRDELRYSLRSTWAYCGWARKIFIVTAGQRPEWLADDDRIQIVDHCDILPADALPTFNSHAIEAALHHIDGLAEQFIYFNDDMFIGRPVRPELFFTPNGLSRVFPSDARVPGYEDEHTLAVDTAALRGRELLKERFGRVATYKPLHAPYPLLRSVMYEIESDFAEIVDRTQHSRFRSPTDLSTAASFAQHYGLATGRGVFGEVSNEYVNVESRRLKWHLDRIRLGRDRDTYCINETQQGGGRVDREALIAEFFDRVLPVPAPWERDR